MNGRGGCLSNRSIGIEGAVEQNINGFLGRGWNRVGDRKEFAFLIRQNSKRN